jgi:uncharacterized protein YkwD
MNLLIGLIIFVFAIFIYDGVKNRKNKEVRIICVPVTKKDLSYLEQEILDLINDYREIKDLQPLIPELLASEVCKKAIEEDFAKNEKPNHDAIQKRIKACQCSLGGEIIAPYYTKPKSIVASYLRSDSHRKCIKNPLYTHIGISFMNRINYCILTKY